MLLDELPHDGVVLAKFSLWYVYWIAVVVVVLYFCHYLIILS